MTMVTCLIQAASATITLDDGTQLTIPRKLSDPPERTAASVARLLCIDRFEYALSSMHGGGVPVHFSPRDHSAPYETDHRGSMASLFSAS